MNPGDLVLFYEDPNLVLEIHESLNIIILFNPRNQTADRWGYNWIKKNFTVVKNPNST